MIKVPVFLSIAYNQADQFYTLREMTDQNNSILAGFLEYTRSASRVG